MANILLVYPSPEVQKQWRFGFSLNLLYLSSILKQAGHKVIFKDYSVENLNLEALTELLSQIEVAIIEFDSFPLKRALNIHNGEFLANFIKHTNKGIKTIAFGYDCILQPRIIPNIDYVLAQEPEKAIAYVIKCLLAKMEINRQDLGTMKIEDLDDLPFPDRTILSSYAEHGGSIYRKSTLAKSTLVQTSRGCMNTCRFCQRKGWTNKYNEHSIDYVISEFHDITASGYKNVWICDDNFTFNLNRAKKILKRLINDRLTEGMHIALSSWIRIDREFLELAKQANVSVISVGIESTNQEILKFYNKQINLDETEKLIRFADQLGVYIVGNFIIGAPMETENTINDTFEYIMRIPFDQVNVKILDYMLGSKLYSELPDDKKNSERHIFACKETALNDFPMEYLKNRIHTFMKEFTASRRNHFINKASRFGLPYKLLNGGVRPHR
ncbi:MAG: radical SAM protein [Desulfitobacteriaceae bacterium]|nr:radical SAM protein [Desulfitobacteriaceae bacterium]MDD4753824.1 radical SAM protein [Desulfitobacteriaceae bacterium]